MMKGNGCERTSSAISDQVIDSVAATTDTDPSELPILYDSVEPDALDTLVSSSDGDLRIAFEYGGCEVVVTGKNEVTVRE